MLYDLTRPLLFSLDPERAHDLTMAGLDALAATGCAGLIGRAERCPRTVMGIEFPNPVGLAAGLDKNGEHIDGLAGLGFGFLEIGTVTPRPQPGNPPPRLFRLPQQQGLINRMGFNNGGVERLVANVRRARFRGVLGINIGKNFDTPIARAGDVYLACLRAVYALASYVTVNISSPNTKNLRDLQGADALERLLAALVAERDVLARQHGRRVPLALKIAPDLDAEQIGMIAALLTRFGIDAVIATNTTVSREGVAGMPHAAETGGLSGAPLRARSLAVVTALARELGGRLPIIGVGGIMSGADAGALIAAGASLVQLYTGLIYRGPALVSEVAAALCRGRG